MSRVKLRSAMRVYVDGPDVVRVAADEEGGGCIHLQNIAGTLQWIAHPEGDFVEALPLADFIAWLDQGGLS